MAARRLSFVDEEIIRRAERRQTTAPPTATAPNTVELELEKTRAKTVTTHRTPKTRSVVRGRAAAKEEDPATRCRRRKGRPRRPRGRRGRRRAPRGLSWIGSRGSEARRAAELVEAEGAQADGGASTGPQPVSCMICATRSMARQTLLCLFSFLCPCTPKSHASVCLIVKLGIAAIDTDLFPSGEQKPTLSSRIKQRQFHSHKSDPKY